MNTALSGVAGKVLLALVAVGILVFLVMRFQAAVGPPEETVAPNSVRVLNPLTGDLRWYEIRIGGTLDAGYYTVEYCWNDHGGDGVPVILNAHLYPVGDPRRDEPSMCPCCGARVVGGAGVRAVVVWAPLVGGAVVGAAVVGAAVVGAAVVGVPVVGVPVVGAAVVGAAVVGVPVVGDAVVGVPVDGAAVVGASVVGATVVGAAVVVDVESCCPSP